MRDLGTLPNGLTPPCARRRAQCPADAPFWSRPAGGGAGERVVADSVRVVETSLIARAGEFRRAVIAATLMLESMAENPGARRAEALDVANAICDGSDAVMRSAETARGRYPVEAVGMMARIIEQA